MQKKTSLIYTCVGLTENELSFLLGCLSVLWDRKILSIRAHMRVGVEPIGVDDGCVSGASPSGTTPGWAVERLWGYRRLLCLVADDSHGKCMLRLLFGAARRTVHEEGHSEHPQAAGVEEETI